MLFSMVGFVNSPRLEIHKWSLKYCSTKQYRHNLVEIHRCKGFQLTRDDDVDSTIWFDPWIYLPTITTLVAANFFHETSACTLVGLMGIVGSQIKVSLYLCISTILKQVRYVIANHVSLSCWLLYYSER